MDIFAQLTDPPAQYRPMPFWSWNADLKEAELVRQVGLMHDVGLGGLIMHARGGLETPYLGEEWFRCINAVVDACHDQGMLAWAYDENGWPSGFANGAVNGLGEAYQQKYLRCREVDAAEFGKLERVLGCYDLQGRRLAGDAPKPPRFLACWYEVNPFYVDLCNPRVPAEFIRLVYERYDREIPAAKHDWLQGFFTDEPQLSRNGVPYCPEALEFYDEKWHESSLDLFPQLFFEVGNWKRFRRRFWKTIGECFVKNFTKRLGEWCGRHDWKLTGHMVLEENYRWQQNPNPSGVMGHYQHFQLPGMDWLGRSVRTRTTARQCWSVCAQMGKRQMLTESFAGCGWNVSLDELRYILNAQMIHGANLLCDHLEGYTLRGLRKRDYPASLFFHQPWWRYFRHFTDWASRIGMLLACGDDPTRVLLLHGITSSHLYMEELASEATRKYGEEAGRNELSDRYSQAFDQMGEALDHCGVGCHFGDEEMMEEHGHVDGQGLHVGKMCYQAVVIPQLANLSGFQMGLLKDFAAAGFPIYGVRDRLGKVFHIDGTESGWGELNAAIRWFDGEEAAASAVAEKFASVKTVSEHDVDAGKLLHAERRFEKLNGRPATVHYFWNSDRRTAIGAKLTFGGKSVVRFNAEDGSAVPVDSTLTAGGQTIGARFPAGGELIYFAYDEAAKKSAAEMPAARPVDLPAGWRVVRATENLLTLDRCDCFADGRLFLGNEYVLTVQDRLLDLGRDVPVKLLFKFTAAADFVPHDVKLLMERPALWQLRINGQPCSSADEGFLFDPAFRKIDVARFVKAGENVIELEGVFHQSDVTRENFRKAHFFESELNKLTLNTEIESIYLAGDFGVACSGTFVPAADDEVRYHGDFALTAPVKQVRIEAVEQSGFPFFAGTVELAATVEAKAGESLKLAFPQQLATACEVWFNGHWVKTLLWLEREALVPGEFVRNGENTLTLKLTNSLRNMLGPHHLADPAPLCLGPRTFFKDPGVFAHTPCAWTNDWNFARFGMALK